MVRPFGIVDIVIPTTYGVEPGWATPDWHEAPVVFVMAHGYGGSREDWSTLLPAMLKEGYGAVVPCMNGQDASPDKTVGFGPKEAQTIVDTVNWLRRERADRPKIILLGISMGGAACWLASEKDASVDAVISEGAYADFESAMRGWLARIPASWLLGPAVWIATSKTGIDPKKIRPVDAAAKWHGRPALVIQAGDDQLMPLRHAQELSAASGAPLWVVPGASHAHASVQDLPGYIEHLRQVVSLVESN